MYVATAFALIGAFYAIFGGLRAVAVSDTYSGVLLLTMAVVVVVLALFAIDFDFSGIPAERLTLIGDNDSPLPWHTLLTGMVFIQTFYWSTNQVITQRAMAAPNLKEAQKGVYAAAIIRFIIVPTIIVVPGIISYKLYGDINDAAYGTLVGDVLPSWLSGIFAAALAAAVLTTQIVDLVDRERTSGNLVVQYAPNDDMTLTLDGLYSKFEVDSDAHSVGHWFSDSNLDNMSFTDNGSLSGVTSTVVDGVGGATDFIRRRYGRDVEIQAFGANFEWLVNDNLTANIDISTSTAEDSSGGDNFFTVVGYNNETYPCH